MKRTSRQRIGPCLAIALLLSLAACGQTARAVGRAASAENVAFTGTQAAAESGFSQRGDQIGTEDPLPEAQSGKCSDESTDRDNAYNGLFSTDRVHRVDVTIDPADWAELLANPLEKTKFKTTVVIDGERLETVSFATKGNTSLSSVANDPDTNRYSFKLNFGKYNKGQTYHGLNKLNLNNLYADATYLKDYLSYELSRQAWTRPL